MTEIETCEGEAVVNNRKGKLIFFYEWNIVLKWVSVKSNEIEGKITIPNLSEENDISEVDVGIPNYKRLIVHCVYNNYISIFLCRLRLR